MYFLHMNLFQKRVPERRMYEMYEMYVGIAMFAM